MMSPFGQDRDIYYMHKALAQARKAYTKGEVPVGAVVISPKGVIMAYGHNYVETKKSQVAHAEMQAIEKAGKKQGDWRLEGCWLYVTLEPCAMCMNLIKMSRLEGVVFGARSPLFGYDLDKNASIQLYKGDAFTIIGDVGGKEAAVLLKTFFQERRKKGG